MYRRLHARTTSQALLDLADAGDEAKARERITFLKKAVQGGHTKANDRPYAVTGVVPTGVAARSNWAVPAAAESAPYGPLRPPTAPHGPTRPPNPNPKPGVDVAVVEAKLAQVSGSEQV